MGLDGEMMQSTRGMQSAAVAGVIEALLLVALVAIVISMVQLVYVPEMMQQKEADHMDGVFNQFSALKSMVDMQAMSRSTAPISSMLTLGSSKLPYFLTVPAQGQVMFSNESSSYISIFPQPGGFPVSGLRLTSIVYQSSNAYFVDQTYALEGGGVIIQQPGSDSVMRADPSIAAVNATSSRIDVYLDIPVFLPVAEKTSTGGEGKCYVRTNFSSNQSFVGDLPRSPPTCYLRIYSKYDKAWNQTLHNTLGVYDKNGCLSITWHAGSPTGYVEVKPGSKDVRVHLDVMYFFVQIGPGWVE